jgi:hypothetical protein
MTEKSLLPKIAAHAGYSFVSLLEETLVYAIRKKESAGGRRCTGD